MKDVENMFCISKNTVKIRLLFVVMGAVWCEEGGGGLLINTKVKYVPRRRCASKSKHIRSVNDNRLYIRALYYCFGFSYECDHCSWYDLH
jgi:hypothetical protein